MPPSSKRALVRQLHREEHLTVRRGLEGVVRDDVRACPGRRDARQQLVLLLPLSVVDLLHGAFPPVGQPPCPNLRPRARMSHMWPPCVHDLCLKESYEYRYELD